MWAGIVGRSVAGKIDNCSFNGNIKGKAYVGGIVGFVQGNDIQSIKSIQEFTKMAQEYNLYEKTNSNSNTDLLSLIYKAKCEATHIYMYSLLVVLELLEIYKQDKKRGAGHYLPCRGYFQRRR